jgi:hypothetical protein
MSNGEVCCILAVCCPPGSDAQRQALEHMVQKARPDATEAKVKACVSRILKEHGQFRTVQKIVREFCD